MNRSTMILTLLVGGFLCGNVWAQAANNGPMCPPSHGEEPSYRDEIPFLDDDQAASEPPAGEDKIPFLDDPDETEPGAAMDEPDSSPPPPTDGGFGEDSGFGGGFGMGGDDSLRTPEGLPETIEGQEDFEAYRTALAEQSAKRYTHKDHLFAGETVVYLLALLIVATLIVRSRRRAWWMGVTLGVSLLVLGLLRYGCICPVGSVSNIAGTLMGGQGWLIHKGIVMLFLLPLVFALLFGRVFCGGVCPMGAIQHLLMTKRSLRAHPLDPILRFGRWAMLLIVIVAAGWFSACALCKVDPFLPIFQFGGVALNNAANAITGQPTVAMGDYADATLWALPISFLLLCVVIARPFCRWLCPYSILLGLLSKVSFLHRRIETSACVNCKLCTKVCPTAAIKTLPAEGEGENETQCIDQFNCVSCGKCSDVCPTDAVK